MAESSRCWPGYEPVKGKKPNEQGSCRPKAESKETSSEKKFRAERKKQVDQWQAEHPGSRRSAAQHLDAPKGKKATAKKAKSKVITKASTAKKSSSAKGATKKVAAK